MKLLRLDLEAFGPFTDETLDLEAGSEGLHLIYGPNEAGKSSALRALQQLFFGIPERSSDAFVHPYERLRIGGRIQHSDGSVLEFIRRKARTKSLQTKNGDACSPQDLARFLGGVEQNLFANMFGINHDVLVAGGEEILRGGGQLGQVLFAAGTGVANLRTVQEQLRTEMDELFKSAGRLQKINKAVGELRELQDTIKKQQLPSEEWERHDGNLRDALAQREQVIAELEAKRREFKRLTRIRDALPVIARRQQVVHELNEYANVRLLAADFSEKRRNAQTELLLAQSQNDQAALEAKQVRSKLDALAVDDALLDQAERIEELYRRFGEYRKDMLDRPRVELLGKQCLHDVKETLRSLGQPPDVEQAERLRLRADEPIAIGELGQRQPRLLANIDNVAAQAKAVQQQLDRARQELNKLSTPGDFEELRQLAARARQEAARERELAELTIQLQKAEATAEQELARLPLWKGTLQDLLRTAAPSAETIDRFDAEFKQSASRLQNLERQAQEKESEIAELDNRARQLELEQNVPSESDLQQARSHRDAGWRLIRRAWLESEKDAGAIQSFTQDQGELPECYERSVQHADVVSDRLRREADRVARKASLSSQHEKCAQQQRQIAAALEKARQEQQTLQEHWVAEWSAPRITPHTPQEMRAWLHKQTDLVRLGQTCNELRDRCTKLRAHLGALMSQLAESVPAAAKAESLQRQLEIVERVLKQNDDLLARRRELQREIGEREQEERRLQSARDQADQELAAWKQQWSKHMTRLGMSADATPAQASAVLDSIKDMFHKLHEADGFRRRIDGIDRDVQQFADDVQALVKLVAADLQSSGAEAAVEQLYLRLKRSREVSQQRTAFAEQQRKQADRMEHAQQAILQKKSLLQTLCSEAGCTSPDELPAAEERSNRRRQLEQSIHELDEQLQPLLAGVSLDEFLKEANQIDQDSLDTTLQQLGEDCDRLEKNKEELMITVGAERNELERMDGNSTAAESAEHAENLLAAVENDAQHYIRLRLAAGILQKGIERYRERNQGPVLSRASRIFADLTLGSFEGLQVDYNDKDEAILTGMRSGQSVGVEGMSDGARDQLYLALRIASLETYLATHEPMPFIVDDILLNFDDDRSLAALHALAELSKKTQIIFFTHHQHLVELARANLDENVLFVHRLGNQRVESGVLF